MESKQKQVEDVIKRLINEDDGRLIGIWNGMTDELGGDVIHDMEDFDAVFKGYAPMAVAKAVYGDDFIPIETRFSVGFDGCAYSYDELYRSPIRADLLAKWSVSHDDDFGLPEVRKALAG